MQKIGSALHARACLLCLGHTFVNKKEPSLRFASKQTLTFPVNHTSLLKRVRESSQKPGWAAEQRKRDRPRSPGPIWYAFKSLGEATLRQLQYVLVYQVHRIPVTVTVTADRRSGCAGISAMMNAQLCQH